MATPVVFDPAKFRRRYPDLASLSDEYLTELFVVAECLISQTRAANTTASEIPDCQREILLFALVCHFATVWQRGGGATGNIASATEGSVSVSFAQIATRNISNVSAFLQQTACGQLADLILSGYRKRQSPRLYKSGNNCCG